MIYLLDDINQLLIKGEGKLRSIISQEDFSKRALYKDTNKNLKRRATFAGTTNYKDLLRNEKENRYMVFTITEQMDFNLLNSLDIMQLWSQIREEVIQKNREAMFSVDDLDKVMKLSSDYIYHSPVEETLNNMLEFDEKGRMGFSDISQSLKSHGINESNNKVGSYLKLLAPEGQEIKIKASNGVRHYKLKWRSRFNNGNQGTPY